MDTVSEQRLNELIHQCEKKMDDEMTFILLELKTYRAKEKYQQRLEEKRANGKA